VVNILKYNVILVVKILHTLIKSVETVNYTTDDKCLSLMCLSL
jgi:hypothetical protein